MRKKTSPVRRDLGKTTPRPPPAPAHLPASGAGFPIVGIGASAGGLDALERFLAHVPSGSGMAFVIIQHLDPTRKGIMPALLQRVTTMEVIQVKDGVQVKPERVYVIPPNKDMAILRGVLHLLAPVAPRGLRLPIDLFLRALAQDQQAQSIGVILSGMGSDGTQGLRAIKEVAGLTLAQDPTTAKFDSMPQSAVGAGLVDIVARVEDLPGRILSHLHRTPVVSEKTQDTPLERTQGALEKVVLLIRSHNGSDFSFYKRNTLQRRMERRMGMHRIKKIGSYVRYLQENPQELDLLFKELLIGVTSFFRDTAVWDNLRKEALPALLASRPPGQALRAWVPGCSTGEEAYSLAIALKEAIGEHNRSGNQTVQIFATDLDRDAIAKARLGVFPPGISKDVSEQRLKRFFSKTEEGYRLNKEIRDMVTFAPQNLIMDPPFTRLDILSCRNLLIYLTAEAQKKLIPLFHYSLSPGGLLLLGSAETIGDCTNLFSTLHGKSRLFRRLESVLRPEQITFPSSFGSRPGGGIEAAPAAKPSASLQSVADQLILQRYAPPAVLTNDAGDIFYVSGRTGPYLEPAAGKANWNIFAMAREGLRYELARGFQEALRQKGTVVALRGLQAGPDASGRRVDISVQQLEEAGALQGLVMIAFSDIPTPAPSANKGRKLAASPRHSARVEQLEQELLRIRAEARATHEEMQTSQEELRSANEELQSTNEEMQSSNEELTTSKEEMQSLNEELQMVNGELQAKVDELSRASNDMKNLLNSTDIATLFLDNHLNVRRFTPQTTKIIKLIPGDTGRPITDLASELRYPGLVDDAREVLRTLAAAEKAIDARDGRWFTMRIMPYRTLDDRIDGVVITFADITASRALEAKLRGQQAILEKRMKERDGTPPAARKTSATKHRPSKS